MTRWRATAYYRTESGELLDVTYDFAVFEEVYIVEDANLDHVVIERIGETSGRTVEAEVKL